MSLLIFTFAGYVLLLFLGIADSSSNRRCFPLYGGRYSCFTQPDPPVALSWSDAQQWCSNIGATLPQPYTRSLNLLYGNALGYFGLRSKTMWLGANSTFDLNDWYWTNGTRFTGNIDHGNDTRKTHAYIIRNGSDIKFVAANPRIEVAGLICQPAYLFNNEITCANSYNSYWTNGKCYTKLKYQFHWNSYVAHCGGMKNLATFDDLDEMSRWFDDQTKFWIGLRCPTWTWQDMVSGVSSELTEVQFNSVFPNNTSPECLASYEDVYGHLVWMNQNCSADFQFICQHPVNHTTTTRTSMSTTVRPKSTTTTKTSTITMTSTPTLASTKTSYTPSTRTTATHSASGATTARSSAATPFNSFSNELLTTSDNVPTVLRTSEVAGDASKNVKFNRNTQGQSGSSEDIFDKYGLVDLLVFGLCGALLLVVIVWLAGLTVRFCKINRHFQKTLPKPHIEHLQLTYSNPYDISTFDNTHALKEGPSTATNGVEKFCEDLQM